MRERHPRKQVSPFLLHGSWIPHFTPSPSLLPLLHAPILKRAFVWTTTFSYSLRRQQNNTTQMTASNYHLISLHDAHGRARFPPPCSSYTRSTLLYSIATLLLINDPHSLCELGSQKIPTRADPYHNIRLIYPLRVMQNKRYFAESTKRCV